MFSVAEIKDLIDWYLDSKHFEKIWGVIICLSTFMINLWEGKQSWSKEH